MTPRADDAAFAAALDECATRVGRGEALADCLADHPPAYREELARLTPLAIRVARLGLDPTPTFRARLEADLLTAVAERDRRADVAPGRAWPGRLWRRAVLLTLVVLMILFGGGAGALAAAEESLPDSPLYQVKEWREAAEVALARDDGARLSIYARVAWARGRELELAVRAGKGRVMVALLALRTAGATDRLVDQALEARARGRPELTTRALTTVTAMQIHLDGLLTRAAPEVEPPLTRLRAYLNQQERRLRAP